MDGTVGKIPGSGHVIIRVDSKDIPKLKLGGSLESITDDELLIRKVKLRVVQNIPYQGALIGDGFSVKYYPLTKTDFSKITTCYVKIDKQRFSELLDKKWIGTRDGSRHVEIVYADLKQHLDF